MALTLGNVVSFSYFGSNLLAPFVETDPTVVVGAFSDALVQTADLQIGFANYVLITGSDGTWDILHAGPVSGVVCNDCGIDNGINALWSVQEPVPEPASGALVVGAVAVAALLRRRNPVASE